MKQIRATWKVAQSEVPALHTVYRGKRIVMTCDPDTREYVAKVHGKERARADTKGGLYGQLYRYFHDANVIRG
jgi:hypothetical protein